MKKFLSLLLAVVMVIGMLPAGAIFASAAEASETMTLAGSTGKVSGKSISWTSGSLTFTANQNTSSNAIRTDDSDHFRLYVGFSATLTCSAGNITKIVMESTGNSYAIDLDGNGTEVTVSGTTITIVPATSSDTYTISSVSKQTRVKSITVTYEAASGEAPCEHPNATTSTTDATCTATGSEVFTCPDCDYEKTTELPMIDHNYVNGVCSGCGAEEPAGYVLTDLSKITSTQSVIITMTNGTAVWALSSGKGTSSAPTAVVVTVEDDIIVTEEENIYWNIANDNGTLTIYPAGSTSTWLYCTSTNNGVRVGTNTASAFTVDAASGYLKHEGTGRFIGVYNSQDWRCYTNTTGNTAGQTLAFYAMNEADLECQHTNTTDVAEVAATCGKAGTTAGVKCVDCGGIISGCEEIPATGKHNFVNYVCDVCGDVTLPAADSTLTLPTANALGIAQGHNTYTTDKYYVTGSVESVSNTTYGNLYIQDEAGNKLYIYGTYSADGTIRYDAMDVKPVAGDTVTLYGVIGSYNGTAQMKNAWLTAYTPAGGDTTCEHTNTTTTTVDATCTEKGSTTVTCNDCGETVSTTEIDAKGHNYVDGTCTNCGEAEPEAPTSSEATITFDDLSKQTFISNDSKIWEENGIVVTNNKGKSTSNCASNSNPARFYKSSDLIIEFPSMTKLVIKSATGDYFTALKTTLENIGTVTEDGDVFTVVLPEATDKITVTLSAGQVRMYSITVYAAAGACVHEVSQWNTDQKATCTEAGSQSGICSKCSETVEKEIPALGHDYNYNAETGMMVCANCSDSFMNTIAEAKAFTDDNKVYCFKGIVTYVSGQTVYMQDATGGICVYFTDAENAANIAVGDELLVMDTLTNYKGLIETTYTTSEEVQVLSNGNELPVQTVTVADLLADTTNEYLGERVTITGLTIGMINSADNTPLTDAEGNTINLYKASGLASNVTENDTVTVTAIVSTYNGYQLIVNPGTAATDVVVTAEGIPSDMKLSEIATAKAGTEGTFYKVKGIVTFVDGASVYMQDATAGIVARLATDVVAPAVGTEIEVIGAYTTYYGLIQLEGATFTEISTGNTVEAKAVTVADLKAAADNAYLSEKVALKNLTITEVGKYSEDYHNVDYTVTVGDQSIKLYRTPAASAEEVLAVGTVINVVAVVSTYNGYQLRVVNADDIAVHTVALYAGATQTGTYATLADAIAAYDYDTEYVKLLHDVTASDVELGGELYLDLNGYDLDGAINTDGESIYVMDSTTNGYTCENTGIFSAVENSTGKAIVPVSNWKTTTELTGSIMRYMTIAEENGYSFHRFYMGITHMSLKPGAEMIDMGYKAIFAGDEKVQANVASYGYTLQLAGGEAVNATKSGSFVSGKAVTLRLNDYDVANHGTTGLTAFVTLTLNDGTVINSASVTKTMKDMVEAVNADISKFNAAQMVALKSMIETYADAMNGWETDKIKAYGA